MANIPNFTTRCTLGGGLVAVAAMFHSGGLMDLDQIWLAGHALRSGADTYQAIGPGARYEFPWPFYYPLTAGLLGVPLSYLPLVAARVLVTLTGGAVLGFAIGRTRPYLWPLLLSWPFISAARVGQWSPYFTAALLLPALGVVAAIKPNLAGMLLAGARTRQAVWIMAVSAFVLLALSFALEPGWIGSWRRTLAGAEHFQPLIFRPGGFLLLIGLLRWRDPDARILIALGAIPQTGMSYEALPALTVARTKMEALVLAVLSQLALAGTAFTVAEPFVLESWQIGTLTLWLILFPALALVLRRAKRAPVSPAVPTDLS